MEKSKRNGRNAITISIFVLSILVFFMFLGLNQQSEGVAEDKNEEKSLLSTKESQYDFGVISMNDGNVEHRFEITNTTDKRIQVHKLYTSCMCTSVYIESKSKEKGPFGMLGMGYLPEVEESIEVGESRYIRVVFDPNAHGPAGIGKIDRSITLVEENGSILQFRIKGIVTP